jgi:branched-subunit amino acid ABC-type transport system permease component
VNIFLHQTVNAVALGGTYALLALAIVATLAILLFRPKCLIPAGKEALG